MTDAFVPNRMSLAIDGQRPLVIWRFCDGKAGHEKQSEGLLRALQALRPCHVETFRAPFASGVFGWLRASFPAGSAPAPDLIVAVGHRSHWPALAARRAHGGKLVVLMRPSLPLNWFDAVIMPEHDAPPVRAHVLATAGVVNPVQPAAQRVGHSLILVGGPSKHFQWNDAAMLAQLDAVTAALPMAWELADSRRTPASMRRALQQRYAGQFRSVDAMPADWLANRMRDADTIWVSMDSVSMIYEALTAGAKVGLLELPASKPTRLVRGIETLVRQGRVTSFSAWRAGQALPVAPALDEAGRAAKWLLQQFFTEGERTT